MNDTFCATRKDVHRFAGFEGEAVGRSCREVRDEEDPSDSERLHLDPLFCIRLSASALELIRLAVLALYVPLWSSVRGGLFKYNQLAIYSSALASPGQSCPVACVFSSFSLLAQHSRASRCCLVLLAQGSPEHLFRIRRFGYLPTKLLLTKQWQAKRPHTTTC